MLIKDKLFTLRFQVYFCYFWNLILNFLNNNRLHVTSITFFLILVNLKIFPENTFIKLIIIILLIVFNLMIFIKLINVDKFHLSIDQVKRNLEEKLDFTNNEISSYFEKEYQIKNLRQGIKTQEYLWDKFKKKNKEDIEKQFFFKIRNLFIIITPLDKLTFLNLTFLIFIIFNHENMNIYEIQKFVNFESEIISNNNVSTNIWIYPPKVSKKEILFVEKNSFSEDVRSNFLVEKNSKILIKVYGASEKNVSVKISIGSKTKLLKKLDYFENTTTFAGTLTGGQYNITFKDKLFQRLDISIDQAPIIRFIDQPVIKNGNITFDYFLDDENNDISLLTVVPKNIPKPKRKRPEELKINRLSNKPVSFMSLNRNKELKKKLGKSYYFSKSIKEHPLAGKEVKLKLTSFDFNGNYGESSSYKISLPRTKFLNKYATQLISIRYQYYKDENIPNLRENLKKFQKEVDKSFEFLKPNIKTLSNFIGLKTIPKNQKFERTLSELYSMALIIEKNSNEFIKEEILKLKNKLSDLIKKKASEEELMSIMERINKLISKLNNDLFEENKKTENRDSSISSSEKSILDKAQSLLNKVDNLLGKKKISELNLKNFSKTLKDSYKKQNQLIKKTFRQKDTKESENLAKEQNQIRDTLIENNKIISIIPDAKENIEKLEMELKYSYDSLKNKKFDESIVNQKSIINIIEVLEKEISKNSILEEKNNQSENFSQKNQKNPDNFDVPIIFERNKFEDVIKDIRKMINKDGKSKREKDYLRELLPRF